MKAKELYEQMNLADFSEIEKWKRQESPVALFCDDLMNYFDIVIHYRVGTILKANKEAPYFEETMLRFVLNNEVFEASAIYYDDRQFFIRVVGDNRIRRINLKVIKEVHCGAQVFKMLEY